MFIAHCSLSLMDKVIMNGELCDVEDAKVSLLNKDMQLGLSVFETMLALDGKIDGFELHLNRLQRGLERLGIEIPYFDLLEENVRDLLRENELLEKRAKVRITAMNQLCWIEAQEAAERSAVCSVVLSDFVLNERSAVAGIKCGSYAENFLALNEAQQAGVDEVIFLNSIGEVAEAATANVFMVKDGVLMTPRLESGCLPGVTRALVIQRAKKADLVVRETAVQLEDLLEADEVFLTNTQIGVQAVDRIGELEFAAGFCPGDVTQKVKEIYLAK